MSSALRRPDARPATSGCNRGGIVGTAEPHRSTSFITSGIRFDLDALLKDTSTLVLVPLFLVALLVVREVPPVLYRTEVGSSRATIAAGLLQATSLPFIVTASMIGVEIGALTPATGAAFVAAGLLSALLFPAISLSLLRGSPADAHMLRHAGALLAAASDGSRR